MGASALRNVLIDTIQRAPYKYKLYLNGTMKRFQESIYLALENEAWYSALALALCIPDICIGFEGKRGQNAYVDWFETYMPEKYHSAEIDKLSGKNCYALRCAYLHDGNERIDGEPARDKVVDEIQIVADTNEQHRMQNHLMWSNKILQIELNCFCTDMSNALTCWWDDVAQSNPDIKREFMSKMKIIQV